MTSPKLHINTQSFFFFLLLCFLPSLVFSQTKVGGKVKDNKGREVPYATVYFKDSSIGTLSDENGKFYLESDRTFSILVVSFMGYKANEMELNPGNNLSLEIILEEETETLNEVVIVSGKQSKKNNPAIDILRQIWENRR